MADFLTRLAERALRTAPVAQPIIASMFAAGQFMSAPIQEAETWNTAGAAPVQDAANAQRAETNSVATTQGEPDDHASLHLEQEALVEANSTAGDQAGTNQPEMNQPGTSPASTSPILLANDAKSIMRQGGLPPNEMPTEVYVLAGALQERADQSTAGAINRPLLAVGEDVDPNAGANFVAGRPGLSIPQTGLSVFAGEAGGQDSVEVRFIAPTVLSPQPMITNQLPAATGQPPERTDTPAMAEKELISAPLEALHLAPAVGMSSRRGEPVDLEQEEAIIPQSGAERDSIVPLAQAERVGISLKQETSLNPLVEETFDSIVASHSQTPSAIHSTTSYIHSRQSIVKEVADREQYNSQSTRDQGRAVPPAGDDLGSLGRSQPPAPLRTIGQVDVLPVEQHLLLPQAQVPQENIPQQQTNAPLINIFTPGLRRNQPQSRSSQAQYDQASRRQDPVTALPVESVPTPPSIHITIGRIDVRAVTPPAPAPPSKPARPGPLLSLDDYLKQSKGGGQ